MNFENMDTPVKIIFIIFGIWSLVCAIIVPLAIMGMHSDLGSIRRTLKKIEAHLAQTKSAG